jgi:hypothetical protein
MVDAVLFTLCEHLEAPASGLLKGVMVRAVATLLAYHSTASTTRLLDVSTTSTHTSKTGRRVNELYLYTLEGDSRYVPEPLVLCG